MAVYIAVGARPDDHHRGHELDASLYSVSGYYVRVTPRLDRELGLPSERRVDLVDRKPGRIIVGDGRVVRFGIDQFIFQSPLPSDTVCLINVCLPTAKHTHSARCHKIRCTV